MKLFRSFAIVAFVATTFFNCGSSSGVISTPLENIDALPLKVSELTEAEKQHWSHLDLKNDTIPGMSVDRAYEEIIKNKKGTTTIVAVIDSGIDIDHEDLQGAIWTNKKEIPGNGIDDDKNGYVDDIHGWNFLGDGYDEQLEFARLLAKGDTSHPRYAEAQAELKSEYDKYQGIKTNYEQFLQQIKNADDALTKETKNPDYTEKDVEAISTNNQTLQQYIAVAKYVYSMDFKTLKTAIADINEGLEDINDRLNYNLNVDFKGRKTGDDPDTMDEKYYGNNNVKPVKPSESHGTHVAGIIAAIRNNGKGANGVANNVQIMSLRAVPNGDEYDKDVALAIRYAADNGAKVINTSFGKSYSPHSDWVRDAIVYAASKDVLIVNAAGNDALDLDTKDVYPNDAIGTGPEVADNFINVGSIDSKYGSDMISGFSNYGKVNVDIFAPGGQIYSTMPGNNYKAMGGTSMASPAVAGIAALIRSQYPKLTAPQVKKAILDSGLPLTTKVIVGGDPSNIRPFGDLSSSQKIANAYNALILASQMAK